MATSSILGADKAPTQAEGRDVGALGPSDTSDSGSDIQGELDLAPPTDLDNTTFGGRQPGLGSDSDSAGTGERGAALLDEEAEDGRDILPDRIGSLQEEAEASEGATAAELEFAELSDADPYAIPGREGESEDIDDEDADIVRDDRKTRKDTR